MRSSWSGEHFDKGSSKAKPCEIEVLGNRIVVTVDDNRFEYLLQDIKISDRLGALPRELRLPDDSLVKVKDDPFFDEAFQTSMAARFIHWIESRMVTVIMALAALVVFALAFYFVLLPSSAKFLASITPHPLKEHLDESVLRSMTSLKLIKKQRAPLESREDFREFVDLSKKAYPHLHLKFEVIHSESMGPNAFAVSGGLILVTQELLSLLPERELVRSILFHEIGHLEHDHALRLLIQRAGISLFLFAVLGADDLATLPFLLLSNAYSRELEREADQFAAIELMKRGENPSVLAEALSRLSESHSKKTDAGSNAQKAAESFLSTHPLTDERMAFLNQFSKQKENER